MSADFVTPFVLGACCAFGVSLLALIWALAEIVVEIKVKGGPP